MSKPAEGGVTKAVDSIQECITNYACALNYDGLTPEAIHSAKVRVIDTLGVLIAGFFSEPARISRNVAAEMLDENGATVLGTRMKAMPEMAAFANANTARYMELTDSYHWPGAFGGHPSDLITPVLAGAEYAQASGRDFITSVVLGYEIYLRISDVFKNMGFDQTAFCCLATAVGVGKLLGLSPEQMSHCISMAIVPNNALRVSRTGHMTMWKAAATGQAGRAGIFAALLARAGMEGPHLPFEGKSGWCDHVALERFSLPVMGGNGTPFKILDVGFKVRPSVGLGISPILAAEKIAPYRDISGIKEITLEVYNRVKQNIGTNPSHWHPDSKESADHSAPFLVAVTLLEGTITPRSYDEAHLHNPEIHALMQKVKVVENPEFTKGYESIPVQQRARITIMTNSGERIVSEVGGDKDDLSAPKSDDLIAGKFRGLTEDVLGAKRATAILDKLWNLEKMQNVAEIPPHFIIV